MIVLELYRETTLVFLSLIRLLFRHPAALEKSPSESVRVSHPCVTNHVSPCGARMSLRTLAKKTPKKKQLGKITVALHVLPRFP